AARSYLNASAIIQAALLSGAEAIHPGYGFLSEDADFAEACVDSGLVFVGPPPDVIRQLGDKASARAAMARVGVSVLPGTIDPVRDAGEARAAAAEVGYPVILKAAAGGGGRGMRVVSGPAALDAAFAETTGNAEMLFGDGRVYLERYLTAA